VVFGKNSAVRPDSESKEAMHSAICLNPPTVQGCEGFKTEAAETPKIRGGFALV